MKKAETKEMFKRIATPLAVLGGGKPAGAVEAGPHHLSNHGCNFSVFLKHQDGLRLAAMAGHCRARSGQIYA
jgi:hypothetical protein